MLIVGTGALATLLAQRAEEKGVDFQLFGPPSARTQALNRRFPGRVVTRPQDIRPQQPWLVAVKTWQNKDKAQELRLAPPARAILAVQNGLEPHLDFRALSAGKVERALCSYGVKSDGPGRVLGGELGEMVLQKGSVFKSLLEKVGFVCREASDFEAAVWHKLAVNASLNTVAAFFGLTNGEVLQNRRAAGLAQAAALEVRTVALACGVRWGHPDPWVLTSTIARQTASNVCSTLADRRRGLPTEYDSINGEVLGRARAIGLKVPALEAIEMWFFALDGQTPDLRPRLEAVG